MRKNSQTALESEEPVVEEPVTEDEDVHMENDPEDPQGLGVPYASYILHDADIPYDSEIQYDTEVPHVSETPHDSKVWVFHITQMFNKTQRFQPTSLFHVIQRLPVTIWKKRATQSLVIPTVLKIIMRWLGVENS